MVTSGKTGDIDKQTNTNIFQNSSSYLCIWGRVPLAFCKNGFKDFKEQDNNGNIQDNNGQRHTDKLQQNLRISFLPLLLFDGDV